MSAFLSRRDLMKSLVFLPAVPGTNDLPHLREVTSTFILDGTRVAQMIVTAHFSARSAESYRASWRDRAFVSEGEWYLQTSEDRDLPEDLASLPGSMQYHTYVWGEAAEKGSMLIGAFRRETITCIIRTKDRDPDALIALAEFFADQPIPETWELAWSNAQMQAFIPTTDTLGLSIEPTDGFWP